MATRSSVDDHGLRPPLSQASVARPQTAPHSGTRPQTQYTNPPSQLDRTSEDTDSKRKQSHQRFVLSDPVAFRYLAEDPSTTVLEQRQELQGYECYVIEQWTTSRIHPTFVITTHTGDPSHTVIVGVLNVPTDEATWSPRLRVYFKALNHYHATRRETHLGILMVTSLSNFPSSLTVIPVPGGDLRKHRFDFFVNEDLKRLGCSGRVGLTLTTPAAATVAKFHQLYRTSDKNELYRSVIELVKLCQSALLLFDKLEIDYADGLLCDVTERAINDWWVEMGSEYYSIKPHDGILGPTTVAGLLGLLIGARNRLHAVNAPVAKDAFDIEAMKRGIGHFQKQQRMTRTRRLDRRTLDRLHKATQKAAYSEGWTVPKAVKSTVAELSGKGGEMVMDVVGRRDRAGIAEIETCDLERFVQLVSGETCKWLWYGKPPKKGRTHADEPLQESTQGLNRGLTFRHDDHGGFTWTARKSTVDGIPAGKHDEFRDMVSPVAEETDETDVEDSHAEGPVKRTTGFKQEARSGIGKLKGAVGFKGHHHQKPSIEDSPASPVEESHLAKSKRPIFRRALSTPVGSPQTSPKSPLHEQRQDAALLEQQTRVSTDPAYWKWSNYKVPFPGPLDTEDFNEDVSSPPYGNDQSTKGANGDAVGKRAINDSDPDRGSADPSVVATAEPSIAGSVYNDVDFNEASSNDPETERNDDRLLRHTVSLSRFVDVRLQHHSDEAYPRHLSFSLAEDSVLTWTDLVHDDDEFHDSDPRAELAHENLIAKEAKQLRISIKTLSSETAQWTQTQLSTLQTLLLKADQDQLALDDMQSRHSDSVNALQMHSEGMLREQKERFEESEKELEALTAKLEYEVDGLKGRVEDVEAGVGDFRRGVNRIEERVAELEKLGNRGERWWSCVVQ